MSTIYELLDEIERLSVKIQDDSKELLEQINKSLGVQDEIEDDGENARPLTPREMKNAEEIEESDLYDSNNRHNV